MTPNDWVTMAVSAATLLVLFAGLVRWLVKHYLSELKPNGGSSLRDEQTRQGESIRKLEAKVDQIYYMLIMKGQENEQD
jgi:hypothetical protein